MLRKPFFAPIGFIFFDIFMCFCIFRNMKNNELSDVEQRFILHWGQMGVQWGINRTVAQVHALLYLSPEPMNAEDICSVLGVARSNVSTSLKELIGWGIVKKVPRLGDKRDHFTSLQDVWELARVILNERKKREIDPTVDVLRVCVADAEADGETPPESVEKLKALSDFLETGSVWFDRMNRLPTRAVKAMVNRGGVNRPK